MRMLFKSAQHNSSRCGTFSLIVILVLCLNIITVSVCIHLAPCHLKLQQTPCKPGKIGILKMLQGALTGVYELEHPFDEMLMIEADDVLSTIDLHIQEAIWQRNAARIRPALDPLYLQNSSFLC